jgi:hypothetical protein
MKSYRAIALIAAVLITLFLMQTITGATLGAP